MLKVQGRPILARLLDDFAHFGCRTRSPSCAATGRRRSRSRARVRRQRRLRQRRARHGRWHWPRGPRARHPRGLWRYRAQAPHRAGAPGRGGRAGITLSVDSMLAGRPDEPDRVMGDRPDAGRFSFEAVRPPPHRRRRLSRRRAMASGSAFSTLATTARAWLREAIAEARADGTLRRRGSRDLLTRVVARGRPVSVVYSARRLGQRQRSRGSRRRLRPLSPARCHAR